MRALAIIAIALLAASRDASADPAFDHVVDAPTAWLPHAGAVIGEASIDKSGDSSVTLGYGLGGVAAVELGADSDVRTCADASCTGSSPGPSPIYQGRATFRLGVAQDRWFRGQPAVVVGTQTTLPGTPRVATGYVVASRSLSIVRLHAGVAALDAENNGLRMRATFRPLGGIEVIPPQFPQSTMMADIEWLPELPSSGRPLAAWMAGAGVRYQALKWGSIELVVRIRKGDDPLGNSDVLVRLNGVWGN